MSATFVTQSRNASFIASFSVLVPDCNGTHLRAKHFHAEHVGLLPLEVHRAHIDDAVQPEARAERGCRNAMHARAGLGDDAFLAHAARNHDLAEHVVDLVRPGVIELLALEINLRAAQMRGQPLGKIERRRPPHVIRQIAVHLLLEGRVGFRLGIGLLEFEHQRHQRFGDEAAAIDAEMAALVGAGAE